MPRRTLIAGNWKMHKTIAQARELVRALLADSSWEHPDVDVVVAPPFTALQAVAEELRGSTKLALSAQTMYWADQGAYTGEISPVMLLDVGCRYVLIGHSERRFMFNVTDAVVNKCVKSALAHGIVPIIAVGETREEHDAGRAEERVRSQVLGAIDGIDALELERCALAYEPIWAIGSGTADDPRSANAVMGVMRGCHPALADVQILYGGSMKPANVAEFVAQPNIDGGLVGGASLDAQTFAELVRNAHPVVAA